LGDDELPDWLKKFLDVNEQGWDNFHYRQALDPLIQYGLLQPVEEEWPGITMHGLVQWRAKKHHSDQAWDKWYWIFITAASWQMVRGQNGLRFRQYLITHLLLDERLDMWKWPMEDEYEKRNSMRNVLVGVFLDEGRWKEAEKLAIQVMETRKRVLGVEHPDTLISMGKLASIYSNQGR
jgi:Tetratricopeptide repeat